MLLKLEKHFKYCLNSNVLSESIFQLLYFIGRTKKWKKVPVLYFNGWFDPDAGAVLSHKGICIKKLDGFELCMLNYWYCMHS